MGRRGCKRTFILRSEGGVLVRWACGAEKVCLDETAVDIDLLADHLKDLSHHHHPHLHHKE